MQGVPQLGQVLDGAAGTVLYCTILHCTVLYCTVLYCAAGRRVRLHGGAPRQAGPVPPRPRAAPGNAVNSSIGVSTLELQTNLREV